MVYWLRRLFINLLRGDINHENIGGSLKETSLEVYSLVVYSIAYGVEVLLPASEGNAPFLQFYVASYSTTGNPVVQTGIEFVLLCVAGNIIVNLLHVATPAGADEMQTVRITIAQTLSCVAVIIVYLIKAAALQIV